ncbi:PQQ-dependent sugar dehydrogenase [Glaciecola siphonariae]|uniref:PQQ-dependent sugar dehydrogenase n=1 Tax=Glaciecola siphonariae TaxID=521012 RepID=A0ABV9LZP8_9ALTE
MLEGLPQSWAVAHAPDSKLWISHREGDISIVDVSEKAIENINTASPADALLLKATRLSFTPNDLLTGGQGGLLDIAFHPDYSTNGWVYLSYSAGTDNANALKIVRFKLSNETTEPASHEQTPADHLPVGQVPEKKVSVGQVETVFEVANKKDTPVHYGARMAFTSNNELLVTTGDGFDYREQAQVINNQLGKVLRMSDQGHALSSNPFYEQGGSAAYVYSLGHRNPQGLLVSKGSEPNSDIIVSHEHGPAGGDEINIIESGANYGWPVITQGKDYIGATISPFTEYPNMRQPALNWTPSIAPSGMIFYRGNKLAELSEYLLLTSLKFKQIYAVNFNGQTLNNAKGDLVLLAQANSRLRDIETDAQGNIWVLSDGEAASLMMLKRLPH